MEFPRRFPRCCCDILVFGSFASFSVMHDGGAKLHGSCYREISHTLALAGNGRIWHVVRFLAVEFQSVSRKERN